MVGYLAERPELWKRWWLGLWAVAASSLLGLAFVLPFGRWVLAATIGFGLPEAFALLRRDDGYPPLTHVLRHFLPKWFTFAAIYALVGTIGSYWFGARHPTRMGALAALIGWLSAHFDTVYTEGR